MASQMAWAGGNSRDMPVGGLLNTMTQAKDLMQVTRTGPGKEAFLSVQVKF
jgi:hypothetical protein